MQGKVLNPILIQVCSRAEMAALEHQLVERLPGPLNAEQAVGGLGRGVRVAVTEGVTPWRTLYVSAVLGGGGAMADVEREIRRLAGIVRREEEALPSDDPAMEAAVDVTYHVCGPILRPDYEGIISLFGGRWRGCWPAK